MKKKDFIPMITVPEGKAHNSKEDSEFNLLVMGMNKMIEELQEINTHLKWIQVHTRSIEAMKAKEQEKKGLRGRED